MSCTVGDYLPPWFYAYNIDARVFLMGIYCYMKQVNSVSSLSMSSDKRYGARLLRGLPMVALTVEDLQGEPWNPPSRGPLGAGGAGNRAGGMFRRVGEGLIRSL